MAKGISVALAMLLLTTVVALAAPAPKVVETYILPSTAQTLNVGDTLELETYTLKHGSHFTDSWIGATKVTTVLNRETGEYESTATFTAAEPGDYTITYIITMTAGNGKSKVMFNGLASVEVRVIAPELTVVGAKMYNVTAEPRYNSQGRLTGYDATGDVYAVMCDDSEVFSHTVQFNFSQNQESRNLDVTIDNETYTIYNIIRP